MRLYEPVKFSDYCEITSSKRIYAKEYVDIGIPFYQGKEVVASFSGNNVSDPLFISENRFEEIKHRFGAPEKGDLLLTSVGTIGVPYRVTGEFDFYFKDGNLTWFRKLNGLNQNFLYYWLQSPQGKAELSKCTIGAACEGITSSDAIVIRALDEFYYQYLLMYLSSDYFVVLASKTCKEGSKMPRADRKYLQVTDVLVPNDSLLEQFSEQINMITRQLEVLAKYNKSLAKARDLALPKLMSGELTV